MTRPAVRRTRLGAGTAMALAGVLLSAGCAGPEPGDQPPGDLPPAGTPASASPTRPASPRPVPKDQRFRLGQTAQFDDGLLVEIAGANAEKAGKTVRGAEPTEGQIVVASVRIENNTKDTFDARSVLIRATYGSRREAAMVTDSAKQLQTGFSAPIKVGDEGVAVVGFAIPASQLDRVTFVIDADDDEHDPVSFTGRVGRDPLSG